MNILLADDDPDVRQSTALVLKMKGHVVTEAADGEETLGWLSLEFFDAMILDLKMPKLNGLEVIVEARKAGSLHCPVIVLTGISEGFAEGVAGVSAVLKKGGDPNILLQTIDDVCLRAKN